MKRVAISILILAPLICLAQDEIIKLHQDRSITGKVVKETPEKLFIDIGPTIVVIPKKDVVQRYPVQPRELTERSTGLYYTKQLKKMPIKELVKRYAEAVVVVSSPRGVGSGFIINQEGHVVTNFHVIEGETKITVTIFQRMKNEFKKTNISKVKIVALSSHLDLALLKIQETKDIRLKKLYLGDVRNIKVGDPVFTIGAPLRMERTVTEGILSSKTRVLFGRLHLQTSTPINPGNSGGPLFNDRGEVIGVTNAKVMIAEGLGFAIPVDILKGFLDNHEAYAYDKDSPSSGYRYYCPPGKGKR
jgi:serine protease Do